MIQIDSPRGTFKLTDEWAAQFAGVPVGTPEPTVVARLNARLKVARATQDPKSEEAINASIQRTLFPELQPTSDSRTRAWLCGGV